MVAVKHSGSGININLESITFLGMDFRLGRCPHNNFGDLFRETVYTMDATIALA